ncbi:unnamed protein product [Meloidogyne enterolobii]|uniref:Uncharacterized protein n=1 Tax=Meloidogyne enterolobii TaxID=390850 RepID=A0ACB0ZB54_MELEN
MTVLFKLFPPSCDAEFSTFSKILPPVSKASLATAVPARRAYGKRKRQKCRSTSPTPPPVWRPYPL